MFVYWRKCNLAERLGMTSYRLLAYTVLNILLTWVGTYFLPKLFLYHDMLPPAQLLIGSVTGSMSASYFLYRWFTEEYPRWWSIAVMLVMCGIAIALGGKFVLDYVDLTNMGGVPADYFTRVGKVSCQIGISFSLASVFLLEAIYRFSRRYTDSPSDTRIPLP